MNKFPKFNIDCRVIGSDQHAATIVVAPLKQGFGTTLGNALRRVLLGSIPGAAVFAVRINSISHEFTAVEGLIEDVTTVILRLKKLVVGFDDKLIDFESLEEKPIGEWPYLKIRKNTAGSIYAKDIDCPAGIKIINEDLKICELSQDVPFEMDIYVTVDRGYRSFLENRETLNTLKIIAVDSLFSPVIRVEWNVVEEKTTKQGTTDRLHLTVVTNGSVKALDALSFAAQTLVSLLMPIAEFNPEMAKKKLISDYDFINKRQIMATAIDELELTMRSFNCLKQNGINTITELTNITLAEAEKIKNLGKKSLNEIISKLAERGLKFRD